jgi:excisionase family DNA binding protein
MPDKIEKMLTKQELCEWLQVSLPTVDRLMKQGMPHLKIGKAVRFEQEDVKKWLEEQQEKK